jgi:hypothetical protein
MPDTVRSKSALQTLLGDNTTGDISPQDVRDFLVSVDPESTVTKGVVASLPANAKAGFLYLPTNGFMLGRDNGSTWDYWGPIFPLIPPADSGFSWVNQGSATVGTTNGGITIYNPASSGDSLRCRVKTAPATPWTLTVYQRALFHPTNSAQVGILFRESSSGKISSFHQAFTGGTFAIQSTKWSSATAFSANYTSVGMGLVGRWLRITDNGTNRICYSSDDGINWISYHSVTRLDFLTGGADQFGLFVSGGNNIDIYGTWLHYVLS